MSWNAHPERPTAGGPVVPRPDDRPLHLRRSAQDRRLLELDGVGTLRLTGMTKRTATAEAGGARWELSCRGWLRVVFAAVDAATGETTGTYTLKRVPVSGGRLEWAGQTYPARGDYRQIVIYAGQSNLAGFAGGRGPEPVTVTLDRSAQLETGLLLLMFFVARTLAHGRTQAPPSI